MNAPAEVIQDPVSTALITVRECLAELRQTEAAHRSDAEALARGRERLAAAEAEVARIAAESSAAVQRHAARLERQTREGADGPVASPVPSDKHLLSEVSAARTRDATVLMVSNLQAAVQKSAAQLASAQRALQSARAVWRSARVEALAAESTALAATLTATLADVEVLHDYGANEDSQRRFGNDVFDANRAHQRLRPLMDRLLYDGGPREMRFDLPGRVLRGEEVVAPITAARARLARLIAAQEELQP